MEGSHLQDMKRVLTRNYFAHTYTLEFTASRTSRNKCLLFNKHWKTTFLREGTNLHFHQQPTKGYLQMGKNSKTGEKGMQHESTKKHRIALERKVRLGCLEHETYSVVSSKAMRPAMMTPECQANVFGP